MLWVKVLIIILVTAFITLYFRFLQSSLIPATTSSFLDWIAILVEPNRFSDSFASVPATSSLRCARDIVRDMTSLTEPAGSWHFCQA